MTIAGRAGVALAIGLLIGLERGWKDRGDPVGSRVAGFRTFGLIGLAGGLAGVLDAGNGFVIAAAVLGLALLLREGFEASIGETRNVSATTMVAALVTFSLGAAAVRISPLLAAAAGVITAFVLWLREPMHRLLGLIEERELSAFLRLLLISIVILPLMPDEGLGPHGIINPRQVWLVVVLISGLGFVGYLGVKFLGEQAGIGLMALAGGLASSTAATLSLARLSAGDIGNERAYAGGVAAAWAVMFVRIGIIVGGIRYQLLHFVWLPLAAMFAVTGIMAGMELLRRSERTPAQMTLSNPLDLKSALVFAGILVAALVVSRLAQEAWGTHGVFGVATIAGLVDVDAISISMSKLSLADLSDTVAARAIVIAAMSNTVFKTGLAFAGGTAAFGRRVLLGAALTLAAGTVALSLGVAAGWM
ncbi:MAG: MgtC/SapB family protein [Hyphomonas sp.]